MTFIELHGVSHTYDGRPALRGIDLAVGRGEVMALIGPTGAGKTTLIKILDLLLTPERGSVSVDGREAPRSERGRIPLRRRMALLQQKPIVFSMSVFDNVACGLRWRNRSRRDIEDRVEEALEMVGLEEFRDRDAKVLSGGETQRVALARALVTDPELLLLDEPIANLDPVTVTKIEDLLLTLIEKRRMTVIMATHDMAQGQRLAHRIAVLVQGKLMQVGTPEDVFTAPRDRLVARLVGVENILPGVITEKEGELAVLEVGGRRMPVISDLSVGTKVDACIRPEHITFSPTKDRTSARNVLEGRITGMTVVGSLVRITVDCGFPLLGVLTGRSVEEFGFEPGSRVFASFKATSVHVTGRSGDEMRSSFE